MHKAKTKNGANVHWDTDINHRIPSELPIDEEIAAGLKYKTRLE